MELLQSADDSKNQGITVNICNTQYPVITEIIDALK